MARSLSALRSALEAPEKPVISAPTETAPVGSSKPPSREGKLHLSAWLSPDYKASLRAIQMKHPQKSIQDLFSEALNDLYSKYNVPTIRTE